MIAGWCLIVAVMVNSGMNLILMLIIPNPQAFHQYYVNLASESCGICSVS